MILSSETLNVESTVAKTQENVLENGNIAPESDIRNDKSSDLHIEKTNLNSEETDKSGQDVLDIPKTETQLPQPVVAEHIQHEPDASGEKISDDHM